MSESVEAFRLRARTWLAANMPPVPAGGGFDRGEGRRDHERALQRKLFDAGFAGICFPAEYGGLGRGAEYQRAFTEETGPYDMPVLFNVPTFGILAATLVDFGTHEQKLRHIPAILRGEELWVQMLSEPSGGSDLAGCLTRADRDGDVFILNGAKIWTSGAMECDYALCLARTNWDAPKHAGLTMFIVKIHQPGIVVEQIRQVDGSMEFCQEFIDDVQVPAADVVGEINDGWNVASRLLIHERAATGGASIYTSGRSMGQEPTVSYENTLTQMVKERGLASDSRARQLIAEAHVAHLAGSALVQHVSKGMRSGVMPAPSGSLLKLWHGTSGMRRASIGLELAGPTSVAWDPDEETPGRQSGEFFLWRQGASLGGGSNEIQRNIISERVLNMPREFAADKDIPYKDVKRS